MGVRGSPERDISSLGAMGRGAWPISGVVRVTARACLLFFSEVVVNLPRFSEVLGVWRVGTRRVGIAQSIETSTEH